MSLEQERNIELFNEYRAAGGLETYDSLYFNVKDAMQEFPDKYKEVSEEENMRHLLEALLFIQVTPLEVLCHIANANVRHTEVGLQYAFNRMALQTPKAASETLQKALEGGFNDKTEKDLFEDFNIRHTNRGGF